MNSKELYNYNTMIFMNLFPLLLDHNPQIMCKGIFSHKLIFVCMCVVLSVAGSGMGDNKG